MPSIDNSFSVDKSPSQKASVGSANAKNSVSGADKSFSRHLQDEIKKDIDESATNDLKQQKKSDSDELPEYSEVINSNTDSIEENDILLSGNELPLPQELNTTPHEIETSEVKVFNLTDNTSHLSILNAPGAVSSQISGHSSLANETESELIIDEQIKSFNDSDVDIVKVEKLAVDGQVNAKSEISVSEAGKTLKVVQTVPLSSIISTESLRGSVDSLPELSQITTPLNHKQWGAELSQRISVMLNNGQHQVAELRLNPVHLGPVSVRLQLDEEQANISFITSHQAVKEAIEVSLPRLREQLQQQGLELGHVDIEKRSHEESSSNSGFTKSSAESGNDTEEPETAIVDITSAININSGVSVYV